MIERTFVEQGIKMVELEDMLRTELNRAGFTKAEIVKTPLVTRIIVNVIKPGLAIGKSGATIRLLTETIGKRFGINNPQLEIKEIERPDLDAMAVLNKMRSLIERGYSWRSVAYRTVQDIQNAGAQGVELLISGKLTGKGDRKRKQRISAGYMKKVGFQTELVDFAKGAAYTKLGAIGLKVKIVRPETVFPDKFNLREHIAAMKAPQATPEAALVEAGEKAVEETVVEKTEIETPNIDAEKKEHVHVKKEAEEKEYAKKEAKEKVHEKKEEKEGEKAHAKKEHAKDEKKEHKGHEKAEASKEKKHEEPKHREKKEKSE